MNREPRENPPTTPHQAMSLYKKKLHTIEAMQRALFRFEYQDKPAFEEWVGQNFGRLMCRIAATSHVAITRRELLQEIADERENGRWRNERQAYAAVLKRRKTHPKSAPKTPPPKQDDTIFSLAGVKQILMPEPDTDLGRSTELQWNFEGFLQTTMQIRPEDLPPDDYQRMFGDFCTKIAGKPVPYKASVPLSVAGQLRMFYAVVEASLQEADLQDAWTNAARENARNAYLTADLPRLDFLAALHYRAARFAPGTAPSLEDIQYEIQILQGLQKILFQNVKESQNHPAWNFGRCRNRIQMKKILKEQFEERWKEIKAELAQMEDHLATLTPNP